MTDGLILNYFELVTDMSDEELEEMKREFILGAANPMLAKKQLGHTITAQFHGEAAARQAGRAVHCPSSSINCPMTCLRCSPPARRKTMDGPGWTSRVHL